MQGLQTTYPERKSEIIAQGGKMSGGVHVNLSFVTLACVDENVRLGHGSSSFCWKPSNRAREIATESRMEKKVPSVLREYFV